VRTRWSSARAALTRRAALRLVGASALGLAGGALAACEARSAIAPATATPRAEPDVRVSDDGPEWHAEPFSPPLVLGSQTFDPAVGSLPGGGKHGTWWIGGYQGLSATPAGFHAL
jgi:hypothetical protein